MSTIEQSMLTLHNTALGAKVIATAGSAEKLKVCKDYGGADEALNYKDPSWQTQVMKITGGKGVGRLAVDIGRCSFRELITIPLQMSCTTQWASSSNR